MKLHNATKQIDYGLYETVFRRLDEDDTLAAKLVQKFNKDGTFEWGVMTLHEPYTGNGIPPTGLDWIDTYQIAFYRYNHKGFEVAESWLDKKGRYVHWGWAQYGPDGGLTR